MTRATRPRLDPVETREVRGFAKEVKFIVSAAVGERIRAWAREHLSADPHGAGAFGDEYVTTSLYFDSPALDVFHGRGSYKRAKYRVRRYGSTDQIFLERKLRSKALLAKRRTAIALDDLALVAEPVFDWSGRWFQRRLAARRLQPTCQVTYRRTAHVGPTTAMRLTLDDQLRARPVTDLDFEQDSGDRIFDAQVIVELKYRGIVPALFKRLLEDFRLTPQPVSKYRLAVSALTATSPRLVGRGFSLGNAAGPEAPAYGAGGQRVCA
jgi:hypothetical protein